MFYWRANCSPICIKLNNLIYQGDNLSRYAASTASTWIWAPALFVSSSVAYYYGLAGLAIFLIPNILCPMGVVLSVAIFFTLLSTIDSNLCAIENYVRTEFNRDGHFAMIAVLLFATIIVSTINITVTQLFLIYGSIRTVGAAPTLLIGFNRFDERRLFWGTIGGLVIGSCGYVILSLLGNPFAFVCTILALTIPLIGYRHKQSALTNM